MSMAVQALDVLNRLTGDARITAAFLEAPLLGRTANAALSFIVTLAGPRVADLQVCPGARS